MVVELLVWGLGLLGWVVKVAGLGLRVGVGGLRDVVLGMGLGLWSCWVGIVVLKASC